MGDKCEHIAFCPFYEVTTENGTKTIICPNKECINYPKKKGMKLNDNNNWG